MAANQRQVLREHSANDDTYAGRLAIGAYFRVWGSAVAGGYGGVVPYWLQKGSEQIARCLYERAKKVSGSDIYQKCLGENAYVTNQDRIGGDA